MAESRQTREGDIILTPEEYESLAARLKYATKLIEAMGQEIVAWTPRRKKETAITELRKHLSLVRGEIPLT